MKFKLIFLFVLSVMLSSCAKNTAENNNYNGLITNVISVENIEKLRNVSGNEFDTVITRGYFNEGDGCGCTYNSVKDSAMSDNGGTVIVGNDGTVWKAQYSGAIPLKLFGAIGDGTTDDTEAIKRWASCLKQGMSGYAEAGNYLFSDTIVFPSYNEFSVFGDGNHETNFIYKGSKNKADLFVFGNEKKVSYGVSLSDFNVDSKTKMQGGSAIHLLNLKHKNILSDVSVGALSGLHGCNTYNGVFFDCCSLTDYNEFEINCSNEAIMICGTDADDSSADIVLDNGTIVNSKIGVHCGGGFGGLYMRQLLIYGCKQTGYLQDNALAKRGNREIFISDMCVLDACHSYCALIDDKLSLQCTLQFDAFISGAGWIEPPSPGTGLYIKNLPQGRVSIGSRHIKHCIADGILIDDKTSYISISSTTYIVGNGGYGISSSNKSMIVGNPIFISNGKGKTN